MTDQVDRILESGHYYAAKCPTLWSSVGWEIMKKIQREGDRTLLFIDDVHSITDVSIHEIHLSNVDFEHDAHHVIMESDMIDCSWQLLERLKSLPKKKRARVNGGGLWHCSGFPITTQSGDPACVLLDLGLTEFKYSLGFTCGLNILPYFYEEEQRNLLRLIHKVIPDFQLTVILHNLEGKFWKME